MILTLLAQGLSKNAIARWMRGTTGAKWSRREVWQVITKYGRHIPRGVVYSDDPGTGDYDDCRFCGAHTRMPCVMCAVKAMRRRS